MCGIAGYLESGVNNVEWDECLSRMAAAMLHRGPDDGGVWSDPAAGVGLANRRLAIVDLSPQGHQPMVSASGRYVITFNGEIYNFRDVRGELEKLPNPPRFRGYSDTEVFLAAVEQWGITGALARVVGMFGMALWDRRERTLSLVRDRLGEKPLYYGWNGDRFLFGSELKVLRAHPGFRGTIDRGALTLYMRHRYIPAPYAIYEGIRKLPPGTILTLTEDDVRSRRDPVPEVYWSARRVALAGVERPFGGTEEEAAEHLEALLRDAVGRQMVADVPLGALLSGGVDSSTIVALMQAQSQTAVKTYTIGSHDAQYDESSYASAVARRLGTDHTELFVTDAEARSVIPRLPSVYDEPFADPSQIPTLLVCELARREVTVALSGDGGDELFGGYSRHFWVPNIWARIGWMPLNVRRATASVLTMVSPRRWDRMFEAVDPILPGRLKQRTPGDKLQKLAPLLVAESPEALYRSLVSHWNGHVPVVGARSIVSAETDPRAFPDLPSLAQRMMCLDLVTFLPDDVLVKVDRASMAVSLEARAPFLDHLVVEFAWQVPIAMNIRDGKGKHLLRRVLERYLPPSLIDRPKTGFGLPIGDWLRGPLREWSEALLDEHRLRSEGFFRPEPIREKWAEHLSGRHNWQHFLWDVLMFEAWLEAVDRPTATEGAASVAGTGRWS
jgi:asparagine synthase (glutamine-hydrolysing)